MKKIIISILLFISVSLCANPFLGEWQMTIKYNDDTVDVFSVVFTEENECIVADDYGERSNPYKVDKIFVMIGTLGYYWGQHDENTIQLIPAFEANYWMVQLKKI